MYPWFNHVVEDMATSLKLIVVLDNALVLPPPQKILTTLPYMQVKISLCCSLKINLINQLVLEMRAGYRQFATVNYSYTSYMYTHTLPAPRV